MSNTRSTYDINAIRNQLKKQLQGGRFNDPDEFKPKKAEDGQVLKYPFFILGPVQEGDKVKGGVAKRGMGTPFFVAHGAHWFNNKPTQCPRAHGLSNDCPICQFGFDLLKDESLKDIKNKPKKDAIVRQWMPTTYYAINQYFPDIKAVPEDLRGRNMFYNAPRTVIDICEACIMRDDVGDPDSPEAFGIFFDESNAFMFELWVEKSGKSNGYKTSRFRSHSQPIAKAADGSPDRTLIQTILDNRHDLFTKIEPVDYEKLKQTAKTMIDGDTGGTGGGFDSDEERGTRTTVAVNAGVGTLAEEATVKPKPATTPAPATTTKATGTVPVRNATTTTKAKPVVAAAPPADEVVTVTEEINDAGNPEIDNLLSQLDDDE